jgi:hypothetical protein
MRAPSDLQGWRCQSGNPPNSLCVRRTRTPLKLGPRLGGAPARPFSSLCDTLARGLPMHISRLSIGRPPLGQCGCRGHGGLRAGYERQDLCESQFSYVGLSMRHVADRLTRWWSWPKFFCFSFHRETGRFRDASNAQACPRRFGGKPEHSPRCPATDGPLFTARGFRPV